MPLELIQYGAFGRLPPLRRTYDYTMQCERSLRSTITDAKWQNVRGKRHSELTGPLIMNDWS